MVHTKVKTISLVCNSKNKTSDNKYKIPLSSMAKETVVACSLRSCTFRNNFYNVVSSIAKLKNNTFYYKLSGIPFSFDIPEGFYSILELLPLVQAGLDAELALRVPPVPTVVLTYSNITGKVTIVFTDTGNGDTFELSGGENPDSINNLLGNNEDVLLTTAVPYEFLDILDMGGVDAVLLCCSEIAKGSGMVNSDNENGRTIGLLKQINCAGSGFGELVNFENDDIDSTRITYPNGINLNDLTFSLESTTAVPLDLGGSDLHVELFVILNR